MNETLFSVASVAAMLGWLALGVGVIAPPGRLRASLLEVAGRWVPTALCALYAWLLAMPTALSARAAAAVAWSMVGCSPAFHERIT